MFDLTSVRKVLVPLAMAAAALAVSSCATTTGPRAGSLAATTWHGWLQFDGQSCATYSWTFNPGGKFVTGVGTTGTWAQTRADVRWVRDEPPKTVYVGTVQGPHIVGTMSNGPGSDAKRGKFQVTKSPPVAANSPAIGAWKGYWIVTTEGDRKGDRLDVDWSFNGNGDFVDSNGERVGRWTLNGSEMEFSFDCSTVFRGTLAGGKIQGTFWLPQGGGVSGDFVLTK